VSKHLGSVGVILFLIANLRKENPMSYRTIFSMAAAAVLGIACISTDALARGGARVGGAHVGGVSTRAASTRAAPIIEDMCVPA
jgi:hypothetical protein